MFRVMSHADFLAAGLLRESVLRHRAIQFVDRHRWSLPLTDGLEIDEFDAPGTTYAVLGAGSDHLASIRLRHARDGSLVERHFPAFWRRHARLLRELPEVTRLCTAPRVASKWRRDALGELLVGLCGHCLRQRTERFFGVVYPSVARGLARAGWEPDVLDRRVSDRDTLLLATWQVSHRVHWELQSVLEQQESAAAWVSPRAA